jgi:hypothetical protein
MFVVSVEGTRAQFVKARIALEIFDNEIPAPRDIIISVSSIRATSFASYFNSTRWRRSASSSSAIWI